VTFRSFALPEFWGCYDALPPQVQTLADAKFELFAHDPVDPSLSLKQKGQVWTVNIGRPYRAIADRERLDFHLLRRVK